MTNYIRACFCVSKDMDEIQFQNLFSVLAEKNCTYNTLVNGEVRGYSTAHNETIKCTNVELDRIQESQKLISITKWLSEPGYVTVTLGWKVNAEIFIVELTQIWRDRGMHRSISFNIEERVFLPKGHIQYSPNNDKLFDEYKKLLVAFLFQIAPDIGIIDFEADLLCEPLTASDSLASWGNFYGITLLSSCNSADVEQLIKEVDEYMKLDNLGLLTFIQPLQSMQAWTSKHQKVEQILCRNNVMRD